MLLLAFSAWLLVCIRPPDILPSLTMATLLGARAPAGAIALSLTLGLLRALAGPALRLRLTFRLVALPIALDAFVASAAGTACRRRGMGGRDRGRRYGSGLALEPAEDLADDRRALLGVN